MRASVFKFLLLFVCSAAGLIAMQQPPLQPMKGERHLANIRQLTFGGENAEAYFSADGTRLIFQSTREGVACDQIFTMKIDGSDQKRVSLPRTSPGGTVNNKSRESTSGTLARVAVASQAGRR